MITINLGLLTLFMWLFIGISVLVSGKITKWDYLSCWICLLISLVCEVITYI